MGYYGGGNIEIAENNSSTSVSAAEAVSKTSTQWNLGFLLPSDSSTTTEVEELNSLFTYEDYMRFIELLLDEEEDKSTKEQQENNSSKELHNNTPVINLLKFKNLI